MPPQDCDLANRFSDLDRAVSTGKGSYTFLRRSFPKVRGPIVTSAIEIRKSFSFIDDCWRTDVLNFRAEKKTYRCFAFAILAVIFRPDLPSLEIRLTDEKSDIKLIRISYPGETPRGVYNYLTKPCSFEYHPQLLEENPWTGSFPERGLPDFKLQYSGPRPWEHWDERDMIVGFGNDDASVRLASMFLDFGGTRNKRTMVRLETAAGYGGVSRLSAEVRFHLPNSDKWPG